jgi:hypothetical protein
MFGKFHAFLPMFGKMQKPRVLHSSLFSRHCAGAGLPASAPVFLDLAFAVANGKIRTMKSIHGRMPPLALRCKPAGRGGNTKEIHA